MRSKICSLVLALHVVCVSVADADEVGIGGADDGGLSEHDEEVELLGLLGVDVLLWITHSRVDGVALVNPNVVAEDPDAGEGGGDDSELACHEEFSSGGLGVLGEENDEEAGTNDHWNVEEQKHHWEVPMNVIVEDQEVVHGDQVHGQKNGEDTDGNDSALNGEAGAAGGSHSVLVGADAKAAAAWGHDVLLWNGLLRTVGLFGVRFLLGIHHKWLLFGHSHHIGGLVFHIIICFCNIIIFYRLLL